MAEQNRKARNRSQRRLSLEEIETIVRLKLQKVSTTEIARQLDCSRNTVTDHWHKWLDQTDPERRAEMERHRSATIAQLDFVATDMRHAQIRIADPDDAGYIVDPVDRASARARFVAQERQALRDLARVAGYDAPLRVETTFETMDPDEAQKALDALDRLDVKTST